MNERAYSPRDDARATGPVPGVAMLAMVRSSSDDRERVFLAVAIAVLVGAVELAQDFPDFCARYTLELSLAVCLVLAVFHALLRRLAAPALFCDGQSLAYSSWLLGAVVDLEDLAELRAREARGEEVSQISLRTRQRELYRLELNHWQGEDVRDLLVALLESYPRLRVDDSTRLWLKHLPPGG